MEGIFFEGGFGRGYLDNAAEIFRALHPENPMSVAGIQRVGEQLRPRFIGGNPPDVFAMDAPLYPDWQSRGSLLDLSPYLAAAPETLNGVYPGPLSAYQLSAGTFGLPRAVSQRMREQIEHREAVDLLEFEPEWLGLRLAMPCLVVHDRKDRVAPFAAGERVVAALSQAALHATDGLGHRRVLDDAAVEPRVVAHLADGSGTSNETGGSPSQRRLHAVA